MNSFAWKIAAVITLLLVGGCASATKADISEFSPEVLAAMDDYDLAMGLEIQRLSPTTEDVEMVALAVRSNLAEEREAVRQAMIADNVSYFFREGYFGAMDGKQGFNRIVTAILEYRAGIIAGNSATD